MEYKILLICAGGISTRILKQKMESYWKDKGLQIKLLPCGIGDFQDYAADYDVILLAPQMAYRLDEVREFGKPADIIQSYDYTIGNCPNIFTIVEELYSQIA